jgi:mannose-6-phosphate isomerase-like protein (cupin superfamily)
MNKELKMWVLGHQIAMQNITGDYDMVLGKTDPGVPGPPPHFHQKFHESFVITEGEMEFIVNGKPLKIKEGQSIDLPPGTLHTFRNAGNATCKWVNVHSPKGFSEFFKTYGVPENSENSRERSVDREIIQSVLKDAGNFDMHIQIDK